MKNYKVDTPIESLTLSQYLNFLNPKSHKSVSSIFLREKLNSLTFLRSQNNLFYNYRVSQTKKGKKTLIFSFSSLIWAPQLNNLPLGDKSLITLHLQRQSTSHVSRRSSTKVAHNFSFSIGTFFVSKSVGFWLLGIFSSTNNPFSNADLMKWYITCMCLVLT